MSTPQPIEIDLSVFRDLLDSIDDLSDKLDGQKIPSRLQGRERSAALAVVAKDLLFLSHLCDKARVAALDAYHASRGFEA